MLLYTFFQRLEQLKDSISSSDSAGLPLAAKKRRSSGFLSLCSQNLSPAKRRCSSNFPADKIERSASDDDDFFTHVKPDFESKFSNTKKEAMTDSDDDDSNISEKSESIPKSNSDYVCGSPNPSVNYK